MEVVLCCLFFNEQQFSLEGFLNILLQFFTTILSPFAESDDLRGDPELSLQSASAPQDAHNSIVDVGGLESITQCPQQLPQMMAAGKCHWPAQDKAF